MVLEFFNYFLALILPGLIGALAFSIAARLTTEIDWRVALIFNLLTYTTMIIGLYYIEDIVTIDQLRFQFNCLSFTRKYILLSTAITIFYGVVFGFIRRLFFWIRRRSLLP